MAKRAKELPTEETSVVKPTKVEPVNVAPIQPRLSGQPKGKTGNKTIFNMQTDRHVSLPANAADKLVRTRPNEYRHV